MILDYRLPVRRRTPKQHRPPMPGLLEGEGLNLSGYLHDESGWGAAGRGYMRALRALGLPLALNDVSSLTNNRSEDGTAFNSQSSNPYDINLICVDPSQHFGFLSQVGAGYFQGHYNIGAWAWELPHFPSNWFNRFAFYDEIWVTTFFVANALAPIAPIPVVRIPPVLLSTKLGSRARGRERIHARPDEFIFLFIFDFHSHLERKNPFDLIEAFQRAFRPRDSVRLVIKCINGGADPQGFAEMQRRARGATISIYDGYWSAEAVRDLTAACDAYVSLHRSEGTGLTIADAMALGKPVIATGWSGNMDFMNVRNSFPVQYELVEIENGVGPYREGEIWAEPSIEHAAQLMSHVFRDCADAEAHGEAARRDIASHFSTSSVAALMRERLQAVAIRRGLQRFQQETWTAFVSYQNLAARIRDTVRHLVPPDAAIAVVSKGDDRLLELDGRRAWHFPQTPEGVYAGYHPADSAAAIEHLEELRRKGVRYFLFPESAFWWLDYYGAFKQHLEDNYHCVWSAQDCIIYHLDAKMRKREPVFMVQTA